MNQQLLDLIDIIEEQQVLLKLLLELYPNSPQKYEIQETSKHIAERTRSVRNQLKFMAKNEAE